MKETKLNSYIRRAEVVAENSPDLETKVGSILVSRSTGSVISEGYNGFIRNANDEFLPKTRPTKYAYMVHAEQNLIYNAARNGVRTDSCFLVSTLSPCVNCARALYQSGIDTVYYKDFYANTAEIMHLEDMELEFTKIGSYNKMVIKPKVKNDN